MRKFSILGWVCGANGGPGRARASWAVLSFLSVAIGAGCARDRAEVVRSQPFRFERDTVGFTNETRWIYMDRPGGGMSGKSRDVAPEYSLRCFVVARLNRQFFDHARFRPDLPAIGDAELRSRIREVLRRSKRTPSGNGPGERVEIPGYGDLRELSAGHGDWLRAEGGGALESYLQRGHWRMMLPFGSRSQERRAAELAERVRSGRPRIVHLVRFPQLSINHAVLLHGVRETPGGLEFAAADPNDPDRDQVLVWDRERREFRWPRVPYFPGGKVHVYEVYRDAWY